MPRLFFFLLLFPLLCPAQVRTRLNDSLAARLRKDSMHIYRNTLAKPFLKIENRNTFIIREPVDFYGFMLGATFWNRHTIAAGFYFLDEKSRRPVAYRNEPGLTQQFMRFNYFNFAYQLVLLNRRYVQVNLPFEVGAGSYYARTTDSASGIAGRHYSGTVIPFSIGAQVIGKITRWIGVSGTIGYRYVQNNKTLLQFNGLYYSYGVWVDARHLIRNFRYYRARKGYERQQKDANAK
jgi:hypothetical protein